MIMGLLLLSSSSSSSSSSCGNVCSVWHPIGHVESIFAVYGILLVTWRVYSQFASSYWPQAESIISVCYPIGHP
jgi:hypothetical protein